MSHTLHHRARRNIGLDKPGPHWFEPSRATTLRPSGLGSGAVVDATLDRLGRWISGD